MSMTNTQRSALSHLADSSLRVEPILSYLENLQVLPSSKADEIRNEKPDRIRLSLIRALRVRGQTAFYSLFLALLHTNQVPHLLSSLLTAGIEVHLCDSLRPHVSASIVATLENGAPSTIATQPHSCSLKVQQLESDTEREGLVFDDMYKGGSEGGKEIKDFSFYKRNSNETYPNFSQPRGHALIISNQYFIKPLNNRHGTEVDRSLGYNVQVKENMTGKEMLNCVSEFTSSPMHSSASSAILCVLTHGEHDSLYGVDAQEISVHRLLSYFNTHNAPRLAGKPKIIIIQACRGDRKDVGYGDMTDSGGTDLLSCIRGGGMNTRTKTPAEADVLVAYATPALHVSWRNPSNGSWFIQALVQVIRERAADTDLLSMLTMVNAKVASSFETHGEKFKQIPEQHNRLTKKFFFFPLNRSI